jgi:hypothetical protein
MLCFREERLFSGFNGIWLCVSGSGDGEIERDKGREYSFSAVWFCWA